MMTPLEKQEYSRKMSESLKGKNTGPRTEEVKKKISDTKKRLGQSRGKKNPMYGKNIREYMTKDEYDNWRKNISNSLMGNKHTEETKEKMRLSALGRKLGEDTKEKLRQCNMGEKNPMYGRLHTEESKNLIGKSHEKKVEVLFPNGTLMEFDSRNKCADYFSNKYGISIYTIKKLLKTGEKLNSKYKKFQDVNGVLMYYS